MSAWSHFGDIFLLEILGSAGWIEQPLEPENNKRQTQMLDKAMISLAISHQYSTMKQKLYSCRSWQFDFQWFFSSEIVEKSSQVSSRGKHYKSFKNRSGIQCLHWKRIRKQLAFCWPALTNTRVTKHMWLIKFKFKLIRKLNKI